MGKNHASQYANFGSLLILLSFTYTTFQFVYLSLIRAYAYYIKLLQTYIEFCLGNDFCGIL